MRALFALALAFAPISAQAAPLSANEQAEIAAVVQEVLTETGVPSASIAIVRDGEIVFAGAYGCARIDPCAPATTETRYAIGSVTKQFTAAALMLQVEQGRLSLDDRLSRFDPTLTRASDVTIRQILSHTSGYRDYWPQDYVPTEMAAPTTREHILDRWARIPLDYEPGAAYRYSNTGFTIASKIIEQVARRPLRAIEQRAFFTPLHMTGVTEIDTGPLPDSSGYARWGKGALRVATKEGRAWLYAIGDLAMRPTDLALWNIALMRQTALTPESISAMTTAVALNNGGSANYGLGLAVRGEPGAREWSHGGAVSGYLAQNAIYPDENLAITVLTNGEFASADNIILERLAFRLRAPDAHMALIRATLDDFQAGRIDRSHFTDNANAYYDEAALTQLHDSLATIGPARLITQVANRMRGGFTIEVYEIAFGAEKATLIARADPETGRFEQFTLVFGG